MKRINRNLLTLLALSILNCCTSGTENLTVSVLILLALIPVVWQMQQLRRRKKNNPTACRATKAAAFRVRCPEPVLNNQINNKSWKCTETPSV